MADEWEFSGDRFILCEGINDKFFLRTLIKVRSLPDFQIRHAAECVKRDEDEECCSDEERKNKKSGGGRSGFGRAIFGFPLNTGFDRLKGIAIVTDNDNERAVIETQEFLKEGGYEPTSDYSGKIGGKPTIIVPLPDNSDCGDLEKLCLPALYSQWDDSEACVTAYLKCTGALNWEKQNQLYKAKVRCIISAYYEDDPYKGLGYLFTVKKMKHLANHKCFDQLTNFLKEFDEKIANIGKS